MSRPRFLADHDLNENIVNGVLRREPTISFTRARDVGLNGRPDAEVLEFAAINGYLLVSHDVNTMPAHAYSRVSKNEGMAGLFLVNQLKPIASIIDNLVLIWSASEMEEWRDQVHFLPL